MKAQKPAEGILKEYDTEDAKCYHIICDCTCEDHAVDTWIEVGAFDEMGVDVTFYVKTYTPHTVAGIWDRIKAACNVLFKGVDTQMHSIFLKEQVARNWISAVENSIDDMKNHKDYRGKK